jgi:hypothetical protein
MSPEERGVVVVAGFVSAIIGLILEAIWLGWLGVIAVRVVRRRRLGMSRAVKDGIGLPGLIGMAVIQVVFWRFRRILRDFFFKRSRPA